MFKKTVLTISFLFAVLCGTFSQEIKPFSNTSQFLPRGFQLLDTVCGDLNRDAYPDCIVVCKSNDEETNGDAARPLLAFTGTAQGDYKLFARNDSVVMCKACGGMMGDPYQDIVLKRGYFSVEHYGGSNWRWTRIITFRYDPKSKALLLHKDAGTSYHTSNPEKEEDLIYNKKDFGRLNFKDYSHTKGQE